MRHCIGKASNAYLIKSDNIIWSGSQTAIYCDFSQLHFFTSTPLVHQLNHHHNTAVTTGAVPVSAVPHLVPSCSFSNKAKFASSLSYLLVLYITVNIINNTGFVLWTTASTLITAYPPSHTPPVFQHYVPNLSVMWLH